MLRKTKKELKIENLNLRKQFREALIELGEDEEDINNSLGE